ncbi:hypothetical protein Ancab_011465 [Ancistrocladus abbreviatus]
MVDPRMKDDQSHMQIEMAGSVVGKTAKSLTLDEEQTNAGGKDLLHVSMCTVVVISLLILRQFRADFLMIRQALLEALKKSKKGSKKLNKMDGKVLHFNKEDGDGVHSGELVSDSQFLNRNHGICAGNEKSDKGRPTLQPE